MTRAPTERHHLFDCMSNTNAKFEWALLAPFLSQPKHRRGLTNRFHTDHTLGDRIFKQVSCIKIHSTFGAKILFAMDASDVAQMQSDVGACRLTVL